MKITLGSMRTGPVARAQEIITAFEPSDPLDWYSGIGNWFIHAPRQSAAWDHYMLCAVHLRPIEGVKLADIRIQGATHEFMMFAMNPEKKPVADDPATWDYLFPHNLAKQLVLGSDAEASRLLDMAATAICDGTLWAEPPLSGQKEPWHSWLDRWSVELRGMQV